MAPRQIYKDVFQRRGVGSKLRERNILPRQFSEKGGDGGVQFSHLQKHGAILRSNVADALDTAQSGDIECFRCAARGEFHHLLCTG